MKNKIIYLLKIAWQILLVLSICALTSFGLYKQKNMPLSGLDVIIDKSNDLNFIDEEDIIKTFADKGFAVKGDAYKTIDVHKFETLLDNDPSILKSEVYKNINGLITVDIKQRIPIARIVNSKNESFYIDNTGKIMPLSNKHTSRVIVANGIIFETYGKYNMYNFSKTEQEDTILKYFKVDDIFRIAKYINEDEFLMAQIEQIYVDKDFQLIPKIGNHTIILGDANNLSEKFKKLKSFYKTELNKLGWNKYEKINLKYNNQIVCTQAQQ